MIPNTINLDSQNVGSFFGPIASRYAYTPELRKQLNHLHTSAHCSENRWFVLDGMTVKAAQSTQAGAMSYMKDGFVLVGVEVLEPLDEFERRTR